MNIRKTTRRWVILIMAIIMMLSTPFQANASTVRVRVRVTVTVKRTVRKTSKKKSSKKKSTKKKKKKEHVKGLDTKRVVLFKGDEAIILLDGVQEPKKVKWSISKKNLVKIKRDGDFLSIKSKNKTGTATITARYKGKKYKCKVYSWKGIDTDIIMLNGNKNKNGDYKNPIVVKQGETTGDWIYVYLEDSVLSRDRPDVYCKVEDSTIATAYFDYSDGSLDYKYDKEEDWSDLWINIKGLSKGSTRIKITNNYNKEVEYIPIKVV